LLLLLLCHLSVSPDALPPEMLTSAVEASMPPLLARYTGLKLPLKIVPAKPINGCQPLTNKAEIKGNIALIIRGNCTFGLKADAAAAAGAAAVMLYNNRSAPWNSMAFDEVPKIPVWGIPQQVGLAMLKAPGVKLAGVTWSGEQRSSVVVEPAMFSSWGPVSSSYAAQSLGVVALTESGYTWVSLQSQMHCAWLLV
jgi:hypothetical protein